MNNLKLTGFGPGADWLNTEMRFGFSKESTRFVVVNVETGACGIQAYATAAELRAIAHAATAAADQLEMAAAGVAA